MLSRSLSLSLSLTPVHAPPARPSVIYLFVLSARCGRGTFNSSGHNLTSVAAFPLDLKASRPSRRFCADGAVALQPEYQMSCRRFVWLHRGFACIVFPIRQTPLSGGSRQLLLAIDTFVVPQSSAAAAVGFTAF